jgi:hypothetical protein
MTQSLTPQTPTPQKDWRQQTESSYSWILFVIGSLGLHMIVFWLIQVLNLYNFPFAKVEKGSSSIEYVEISKVNLYKKNQNSQKNSKVTAKISKQYPKKNLVKTLKKPESQVPKQVSKPTTSSTTVLTSGNQGKIVTPENTKIIPKTPVTPKATPTPSQKPKPQITKTPVSVSTTPTTSPTPTPEFTLPFDEPIEQITEDVKENLPKQPSTNIQKGEKSTPLPTIKPTINPADLPSVASTEEKMGATWGLEMPEVQKSIIKKDLPDILPEPIIDPTNPSSVLGTVALDGIPGLQEIDFQATLVINKDGRFESSVLPQGVDKKYQRVVDKIFRPMKFNPGCNKDGKCPPLSNLVVSIKIEPRFNSGQ